MLRIVQCPKCRALLHEPPQGNPFYQCGGCSTTLQAKHATKEELEATLRRSSVDQRSRSSFSESSSGEISSDAVADEFLTRLTGSGNDSPLLEKKQTAAEAAVENGLSPPRDVGVFSELERVHLQDKILHPYPQSLKTQALNMKQQPAPESLPGRAPLQEFGPVELCSSMRPDPTHISALQSLQRQVRSQANETCIVKFNTASSVRRLYGTETLSTETRVNRSGESQNSQDSRLQRALPDFSLESLEGADPIPNLDLGGVRNYEASANITRQPAMTEGNIASGVSRTKLRWQVRGEYESGDDATSSGADDGASSPDDGKSSVSVKETTAVEYIAARNGRAVHSRRRSFSADRRLLEDLSEEAGPEVGRSPSQDSDKFFDMYQNPSYLLDYEPSDTSSQTTVDEVEMNGGAGAGRDSSEIERYRPPLEQGILRPSRPNIPRSHASSGRISEENSPYSSTTASPDNHLDNRITAAARRHSWDERLSRMGATAAGYTGPQQSPLSVRQKSTSQDYGSDPAEQLQRMSSDPDARRTVHGRQLSPSVYEPYRQPHPPALRSFNPQQQWVNRYVVPSQTLSYSWTPNSTSRTYFPEHSPLHPLARPSSSLRQIPGQLPSKQGHYPPLPAPGALPHVLCQYCGVLLAVPSNLPPNAKDTQKLRCGSCRKISIFSVPKAEGSNVGQLSSARPDPQHGQSLLASSPDSQAELSSAYKGVTDSLGVGGKHRIERRLSVSSVSDIGGRQYRPSLCRKHSLGNEDFKAANQEGRDGFLSERIGALTIAQSGTSTIPGSVASSTLSETLSSDTTSTDAGNPAKYKFNHWEEMPVMSGNNIRYQNAGDHLRLNKIVPTEEKRFPEGLLSDSDSERSIGSPQLNPVYSGSPRPPYTNSSHSQDPKSFGHTAGRAQLDQAQEGRGLNKALNRIFLFRKSKLAGAGGTFRRKVLVNEVPISDHFVKKAEEQAGPIHPGSYWYDHQAGFWGVTGGQCLGIIPPFIEEFNYPIAKDCAGGQTGILANGRELHYMDLEKLSRRGLPSTPGMSYHIEIDGRVIEEVTGSELRPLGRLAPSLEQRGRGVGMYVPPNNSGGGRS